MLEQSTMGNKDDLKFDVFDQLEEALEERAGNDRRKKNTGQNAEGLDRRKGDRRKAADKPAS